MTLAVTPHLDFRGQARAALAFYGDVFGGDPTMVTSEAMGRADAANRPGGRAIPARLSAASRVRMGVLRLYLVLARIVMLAVAG